VSDHIPSFRRNNINIKKFCFVKFMVLIPVTQNGTVFWDVTPWSLV
jgi:hypothetical protein